MVFSASKAASAGKRRGGRANEAERENTGLCDWNHHCLRPDHRRGEHFENAAYHEKTGGERVSSASQALHGQIEQMMERSQQNAVSISHSAPVIRALQNGDLMKAALDELNGYLKADTISVTDARGDVLIRRHKPEKRGDNILEQSNVQQALRGAIQTTMEAGALVKLSSRSGAPVRDENGTVIGTVVTGYTFENPALVDELKALHNIEFSIFQGNERISITLMQNGERMVGTQLEEQIFKNVLQDGQRYTGSIDILAQEYIAEYDPLLDAEGRIVGAVFAELSEAMGLMAFRLKSYISDISRVLFAMSENDFTVRSAVEYMGDFAPIEHSLETISS